MRDLLLWANNFADARVGTAALLARMQTATVLTGGQATQSGMGFGIGNYRGARTFRTSGGDSGVATELVIYPDQKLAIAVLCNMDSVVMGGLAAVNPDDLTNGVADISRSARRCRGVHSEQEQRAGSPLRTGEAGWLTLPPHPTPSASLARGSRRG